MKTIKEYFEIRLSNTLHHYKASNGNNLVWNDEIGVGYLKSNVTENIYDKGYWDNYQTLKNTQMGISLTSARVDLAKKYVTNIEDCIDIGVGNGQFVEEFGCAGADINPHAIEWLKANDKYGKYNDGYGYSWFAMWDSIEHIEDNILIDMFKNNHTGIVLSTPIYNSFEHCIRSKHLKPDEHIWYFTTRGIIFFMEHFGYKLIEMNTSETKLGREDIGSFVFVKK